MTKRTEFDALRTNAALAHNVTRLALEHTAAQLASGTLRDPAGAARNAAVVAGINIDKLHQLEDRPEEVETHPDPRAEGIALLRRFGIPIPGEPLPELPTPPPHSV